MITKIEVKGLMDWAYMSGREEIKQIYYEAERDAALKDIFGDEQ